MSCLPDYQPCHDPDFPDLVLNYLLDHPGVWVHPSDLFLAEDADSAQKDRVRDAVHHVIDDIARRLGFIIEGDRRRGYRYHHFERRRYVHLAKVGEWPRRREGEKP